MIDLTATGNFQSEKTGTTTCYSTKTSDAVVAVVDDDDIDK